jgi:hypothetical protein
MRTIAVLVFAFLLLFFAAPFIARADDEAVRKAGAPRILVIYDKSSGLTEDKDTVAVKSVYEGIVEALTDKKYRVVDRSSAERFSMQIAETHDIDPVLNKAAAFGLTFKAEYTLYYRISGVVRHDNLSSGALIRVKVQVIDNTAAQVVTAKSAEFSSAGLNIKDALEKAARGAGKKVVVSISPVLEQGWAERVKSGTICTVVMEWGENRDGVSRFEGMLEAGTSVASMKELESGGGKSTYEIVYKGKRDQLDRDILKVGEALSWTIIKVRSEGDRSTWQKK